MTTEYYAGIGSRKTPDNVLEVMEYIGFRGALLGYGLRSGGADGADAAFERGHRRAMNTTTQAQHSPLDIFLPWRGFNGHPSHLYSPTHEAYEMAAQFHPNWAACSHGAMALHARNCHQVLGLGLKIPVKRVICWTPNASGSGGTGQALRIARHYGIEIHDLGDPTTLAYYVNLFGL